MSKPFPIEQIPNESNLFYRVHKNDIVDGEPIPGAFRAVGDGMSTDWDKYSTPQESLNRSKDAKDNGILIISVADARNIKGLEVEHKPSQANRSHSLVLGIPDKGEFRTRIRLMLKRISKWQIKYNPN